MAGWVLAAVVTVQQALMLAVFPVVPNNDSVSYVDLGHASAAKRPVDHYAAPDHIPTIDEIPAVDVWRDSARPSYGYPWIYLALPPDWDRDTRWVLAPDPPLAGGRFVPHNREWDVAYPIGGTVVPDLVHWLVPPAGRAFALVLVNHVCVLATALVLWRIGVILGWPIAGWIAGLVFGTALFPGARANELMTEATFTLLSTLALYFTLAAWRRPSPRALAAAGALAAAALGVRAVAALCPLILATVALRHAAGARARVAATAAWAAPFAAVMLAMLIHNGIFYHRFGLTTSFGRHLFNRAATVDRTLDLGDATTRRVLELAEHPRLGGTTMHPLQESKPNVNADGACWALYWMLRWQGMSVAEADGALKQVAIAAIRKDPIGYLGRSLRGIAILAIATTVPMPVDLVEPEAFRNFHFYWFVPQLRLAPYNWIEAQWRVFKKEIPLGGPPQVLPKTMSFDLMWLWQHVPDVRPLCGWLALPAVFLALLPVRRWDWLALAGWALALMALPALVQAPNARYGEPSSGLMMLLAAFAIERFVRTIRKTPMPDGLA